MKTLTTNQIETLINDIREHHALNIIKTTARTVEYNAGAGKICWYNYNTSSDENLQDIKTFIINNNQLILNQMILKDKYFDGVPNNVTGNQIIIKYTHLKNNGKTWTELIQTIYRTK